MVVAYSDNASGVEIEQADSAGQFESVTLFARAISISLTLRSRMFSVSSSRVRCEAGILVAMGCFFAGLAKARLLNQIRKGCTPPIFQQI